MPKNKKPAGGRPSRNFDPRYGQSSATKPGSRSKNHRGFRPEQNETSDEAPKKRRWTSDERAARGVGASRPRGAQTHSDRGGFGHRDDREFRRDDRTATEGRPEARGDRRDAERRDDYRPRTDRPRDDRARDDRARRYDDRPRRDDHRSDDRAPRRFEGERPRRDDREFRREDGPRRYDDRPRRDYVDRNSDRSDAAPRRRYDDDRPRRDDRGFRDDRPRTGYRDRSDDRPRRSSTDERPRRSFGDDRPRRTFDNDRPRRNFDNDRPRRSFGDDRPRRRFEDRDAAPRERRGSDFYPEKTRDRTPVNPGDDVVLERLEAQAIEASEVEGIGFADLGLGNNIVRALADLGAATPFPIQAATIPEVLAGRDVLGRGRTGSGKTIAFAAPLVERLLQLWMASDGASGKRTMGRSPRALILAPTRELALQIDRTVQPIARSVGLFTTQIYGGVPQARQVGALRRGVDIVVGTPGRIEDLIEQGHLDLSQVVVTVLDEADHMCDLGFLEPVQRILRRTSEGGQKLLFSATLDSGVAALVKEFLVDPAVHEVAGEDQASGTINHRVFVIEQREKRAVVEQLADRDGKTLIFARTRSFAEELAEQLDDAGIPAVSLHGDLNQSKRQRNLDRLTSGRVSVLVATDVAARGIHVDDIDLVIQADAPDEYKTYLHRSGRTGRAGKPGTVVTLISRARQRKMAALLGRAEIDVDFEDVAPGDALLDSFEHAE
jgi:superfamily II DNA/RNA helicase